MRQERMIEMKRVYNGESTVVTVVSDGNEDIVIQPGETVEMNLTDEHLLSDDALYVQEEGDWYFKEVSGFGGRIEIYNAK